MTLFWCLQVHINYNKILGTNITTTNLVATNLGAQAILQNDVFSAERQGNHLGDSQMGAACNRA